MHPTTHLGTPTINPGSTGCTSPETNAWKSQFGPAPYHPFSPGIREHSLYHACDKRLEVLKECPGPCTCVSARESGRSRRPGRSLPAAGRNCYAVPVHARAHYHYHYPPTHTS